MYSFAEVFKKVSTSIKILINVRFFYDLEVTFSPLNWHRQAPPKSPGKKLSRMYSKKCCPPGLVLARIGTCKKNERDSHRRFYISLFCSQTP
jgi:hypothetical protein